MSAPNADHERALSSPTHMPCSPCPLCGYDAPGSTCPHCSLAPAEPSLARPAVRAATAVFEGVSAVPRGLGFLLRTSGTKRWLIPPFVLTLIGLGVSLSAALGWLGRWRDANVPQDLAWRDAAWLEGLAESWGWIHAALAAVVVALEWAAELLLATLASGPFSWLASFLVATLVFWYVFSIFYEAVSGPFLDEIQARLESVWFGADPRSRLSRPNDLPSSVCARLTIIGAILATLSSLLVWVGAASLLWLGVALPLPFLGLGLANRRYGEWLLWIARIEGGALWVGIQASIVTGLLLVLALPLYLVPVIGYFLYAGATGFATAIALLDIATERRGWSLRQRLSFVRRHLAALTAFGITAGALLAVPILGPMLVVPGASIGGLWLLCRLDKSHLRPAGSPLAYPTAFGTPRESTTPSRGPGA